ncbi:GntR family transcriptional regulator, partial [Priestia megaterium]
GVSKTPVREALLRLEYVGLIRSGGPGGGQQVVTASKDAIISAYEVRAGLEVQVARAAAERGDAMLVAQARLHAEEAKAAVEGHDRSGFKAGDQNFHLTLSQATQNHLLARFTRDVYDLTSALRQRDVPDAPFSLECAENHLDVVEAVERGDADTAGSLMRQHIDTVRDRVLRAFADSI